MLLVAWTALLAGATLTGLALVGAMSLREGRDVVAGLAGLPAVLASLAGIVGVTITSSRIDEGIIAALLGVAAFAGGFALGGALLAQRAPDPPPPSLPDPMPDSAPDTLGVVVLADAEPERYDPGAVSRELRLLAEAGVELPPEPLRVFVYSAEKTRYRTAGGSSARETARAIASRLTVHLDEDELPAAVEVAWADGRPLVDEAVASLVRLGARRVVVAELAVAESALSERAKRRIDVLRPAEHRVRIAYTGGLWGSAILAERLADRVVRALGDTPPAAAGAALLAYGRPQELATLAPVAEERELLFQQRVRALLVGHGFDEQRVRLGWIEWQEPGVTEVVRHLAALGCEKIVVLPATLPADTVSSTLDVRDAVAQARVDKTADVVLLPGWGDDPVLVEAMTCGIRETAAEMASQRP